MKRILEGESYQGGFIEATGDMYGVIRETADALQISPEEVTRIKASFNPLHGQMYMEWFIFIFNTYLFSRV